MNHNETCIIPKKISRLIGVACGWEKRLKQSVWKIYKGCGKANDKKAVNMHYTSSILLFFDMEKITGSIVFGTVLEEPSEELF